MQKYDRVARAESVMTSFLSDLQNIVNIDSGTYTKNGVDQVGAYLQARFRDFGFSTYVEPQQTYGDHLVAVHKGQAPAGPRLLLVGHMDTVFAEGEAKRRPFTQQTSGGWRIAKGPGVLDMKSGLLIGMYGLHMLIEAGRAHYQTVTFVCNSDEEIGSPTSKALIGRLAQQSDAVIVLEPGRIVNTVVSARRGIGHYRIEVRGVAAHAGVDPQNGRNAILELSHQIIAVQALNGTIPGVTLNVGVIRGGERTNIVPDFAYCEIDVRISDQEGIRAVESALRKVNTRTILDRTSVKLSGGMRSMPFTRNERGKKLVQLAIEAGRPLGVQIEDVASGGASDANTTAALGISTIDGLGAAGALAHNPDEYIEVDTLPTRIALLAGLVERIGSYYADGRSL